LDGVTRMVVMDRPVHLRMPYSGPTKLRRLNNLRQSSSRTDLSKCLVWRELKRATEVLVFFGKGGQKRQQQVGKGSDRVGRKGLTK
jgi:hypothetical protein